MKIYMNGYKDHWISPYTIVDYLFYWTDWSKCSRNKSIIDDKEWIETPEWAEKLSKRLEWISLSIKWVWDKFDHQIRYVKIDRYDTWSMDHTLAYIVLPMLKQLRDTKQGSAMVDDEDVPEELRYAPLPKRKKKKLEGGIQVHSVIVDETDKDEKVHKRWDWVINEMIWAFEQKVIDDDESQFFDHSAYTNDGDMKSWFKDMSEGKSKTKVDWDGLKSHQARKTNAYRLFGKYYEGLWD